MVESTYYNSKLYIKSLHASKQLLYVAWTACKWNKCSLRKELVSRDGQTCISKVYDVWARNLLISTLVSFSPCLPDTNATPSSHGWHARRSLLWHRRHTTLYDRSSRYPISRGGCHSSCTDVWLTTETTLRGADGTPGERWLTTVRICQLYHCSTPGCNQTSLQ